MGIRVVPADDTSDGHVIAAYPATRLPAGAVGADTSMDVKRAPVRSAYRSMAASACAYEVDSAAASP